MKHALSLQRRLGIGLTLGVMLLWLGATTVTAFAVQHAINRTLDSSLEEMAQRLLSLAVVEIINRDNPNLVQHIASLRIHDEYITYLVRDVHGNPLLTSHDVDLSIFPPAPETGLRTTATHRLYGTSAVSDTFFIEVAEPLLYRQQVERRILLILLMPLAILAPLSLIGIWWFVRHSLRGILAYRDALESRGAGDFSRIEDPGLPAEIVPIAEAVNHLLDRLYRVLESERSFTANSAHELRTPLAATLAQVQRLQREAPDGPLKGRAMRIETSLRELSRLSEKLMQLAKAESGGLVAEVPQDISQVLAHVVNDLREKDDSRLKLTLPENTAVFSSIDLDAFAILCRNLIENALKHGAEHGPVEVSLTADRILRVRNTGPVVPAAQLETLTDRFVRAETRASGSGLGLAIVSAIAAGSGATLTLASPAPGLTSGFEASLRLPR